MFGYPKFNENGEKILTQINGINSDMLMDISVFRMKKGDEKTFIIENQELAILLTHGVVEFICGDIDYIAERTSLFSDLPTCLHICKNTKCTIKAISECEFIYQSTENERNFPAKLYKKEDIICTVSCLDRWENTAVRDVNTIFDYDNAPYSNMVVGEVLARQGRWWSYVPHYHPQPEVYYYEFDREEGFGACFIGETAYTVKNGSVGCFEGGKTHVQTTAPGFPMYCCWMIRHLKDNPWDKTRIVDKRYEWLDK